MDSCKSILYEYHLDTLYFQFVPNLASNFILDGGHRKKSLSTYKFKDFVWESPPIYALDVIFEGFNYNMILLDLIQVKYVTYQNDFLQKFRQFDKSEDKIEN